MNCSRRIHSATFLLVALWCATAQGQNLLQDPGFENGFVPTCGGGSVPDTWFRSTGTPDTYSFDCPTAAGAPLTLGGHFTSLPAAQDGIRFVAATDDPVNPDAFGQQLSAPLNGSRTHRLSAWFTRSAQLPSSVVFDIFISPTNSADQGTFVGSLFATTPPIGTWLPASMEFCGPELAAPHHLIVKARLDLLGDVGYVGTDAWELVELGESCVAATPIPGLSLWAWLLAALVLLSLLCLRLRSAAVLSLLIVVVSTPAFAQNLLVDASFEDGSVPSCAGGLMPDTWFTSSGTPDTYSYDCANKPGRDPAFGGHFSSLGGAVDGERFVAVTGNPVDLDAFGQRLPSPLSVGTRYTLSGRLSPSLVSTGSRVVDVYVSTSHSIAQGVFVGELGFLPMPDGAWTADSVTFCAPDDAEDRPFLILSARPNLATIGYVAIDDLQLTAVADDCPTAFNPVPALGREAWLIGLGLLALVGWSRRRGSSWSV